MCSIDGVGSILRHKLGRVVLLETNILHRRKQTSLISPVHRLQAIYDANQWLSVLQQAYLPTCCCEILGSWFTSRKRWAGNHFEMEDFPSWVANAGLDFHRESQLLLNFSVNGVGCWFAVICKCWSKFCELRCCEWCCKPIVNSIAGRFPLHSNPLVLPLWVATAGLNFVNPIVVNSVAICLEFHCCECSFHCLDFRCCEWCYYGWLQVLWMGLVSLVEFVLCLRIEFVGWIELLGLDEDCHLWGGLSFCYSVIFGIKSVWSEVDWVECYFHALKFANFRTW